MSTRLLPIVASVLVFTLPFSSRSAEPAPCPAPVAADLPVPGFYPQHELSPSESLSHHEVVFLGEVVVPARKCSLGFCAGIRLVQTIKGRAPTSNLIQVARPGETDCGPLYFNERGQKWVVFANRGTSKTGLAYLYAEDHGPSFPAPALPDFGALEGRYWAIRGLLDRALEGKVQSSHLR